MTESKALAPMESFMERGWKGFYFAIVQAFMRTTRIARMLEAQKHGSAYNGAASGGSIR
jgi:hypothetical protein